MTEKRHCKICGGRRDSFSDGRVTRCVGCGTPVGNCHLAEDLFKRINRKLCCPNCRSPYGDPIDEERFCCKTCDTVYEAPDFNFVDSRPEENAMKQEAYQQANTERRRRHGGR